MEKGKFYTNSPVDPQNPVVVLCTGSSQLPGSFAGTVVKSGGSLFELGTKSKVWICESFIECPDPTVVIADENRLKLALLKAGKMAIASRAVVNAMAQNVSERVMALEVALDDYDREIFALQKEQATGGSKNNRSRYGVSQSG